MHQERMPLVISFRSIRAFHLIRFFHSFFHSFIQLTYLSFNKIENCPTPRASFHHDHRNERNEQAEPSRIGI